MRLSSVPGALSGDEGNLLSTHGYSATGRRAFFVKLCTKFPAAPTRDTQGEGSTRGVRA